MKTDEEIRRDVESELQWDPSIDDKKIGVIVNGGVVTLTGEATHYAQKCAAEDIAKRLSGVRAIANDIQVNIPVYGVRTDTEIAEAAANDMQVKPVVKDGWVTLSGKVSFGYQRNSAANTLRSLIGVKGITNDIVVVSTVKGADVKQKIEDAFRRHAIQDATDIEVKVDNSTVTLEGHVHTWQEHADADRAAWAAPGVAHVENRLVIQ
jgi:osmotically-inducible protein OsmY